MDETPREKEKDQGREPVNPALCANCGYRGTPLCTHPDGYYQEEPAGLNRLIADIENVMEENGMTKTPEQKERDQKLVNSNLNFFYELFPEEVEDWVRRQWPDGLENDKA